MSVKANDSPSAYRVTEDALIKIADPNRAVLSAADMLYSIAKWKRPYLMTTLVED